MGKRKTRILFADDEPAIRMTLPAILQQEGFEVSVAATGPDVITGDQIKGATRHGQERYRQGYTAQRIAIEARLLHSVISRVLHKHLLSIDMSTCISDIMLMGEGLHEEFEESIRAFEEQ